MKEKLFKKGFKKRLFSVVLALTMVVALMPMNSLTVFAAEYTGHYLNDGPGGWSDDDYTAYYKVGDILTNCKVVRFVNTDAALYCDGVMMKLDEYFSGTVVKLDGNIIYLCSSSNHETKKNATTGLCPTCYPKKNYEGYYISNSGGHDWDYEKGMSMGYLKVGDTLTDCIIQGYHSNCAVYCDGESIPERTTISGTVTIVKIAGDSFKNLYLCSASDHETNADETTELCPTCDPDAPKHAHSFTYSVDGAALKATCGNATDCGLATSGGVVSLTLTAGTQDYSNPFGLSIDGTTAWVKAKLKDPVIVYSDSAAGEYSETLPTTAGTHYAKIKVEDDKTAGTYHYSGAVSFTTAAHNITFIAPSGATIGKQENVVAGESVSISAPYMLSVDESYVGWFDGWTCEPSGFEIAAEDSSFIMPNADITIEAEYENCWLLTVNNNETVTYEYHVPGASISVTAATAPTGKKFTGWTADGVTLGDSSAATATFTMPSSKVALTANYYAKHTVTVTNGTTDVSDGKAFAGDTVSVTADAPAAGKKFKD